MTLDLPALRKLLADNRENREQIVRGPTPYDRLANALVLVADSLLIAAEERDALLAAAGSYRDMVRPAHGDSCECNASADRLDEVLDAIRRAKEPTK